MGRKVVERVQFVGIDGFNRPVFKSLDKQAKYYGSVHKLFSYQASEKEVLEKVTEEDLCYFGDYFDCEPMGSPAINVTIERSDK